MPVIIYDYEERIGTYTPEALKQEGVVAWLGGANPVQIQGFIDTSNMREGDTVIIRELSLIHI